MSGVDGGGLSADEQDRLCDAALDYTQNHAASAPDKMPRIYRAVERIVAARVAAAEQRAERVTAAVEEAIAPQDAPMGTMGTLAEPAAQFVIMRVRAALTNPAPREYDDGGPRVREAVERAERDAEVAAVEAVLDRNQAAADSMAPEDDWGEGGVMETVAADAIRGVVAEVRAVLPGGTKDGGEDRG